MLYWTGRHYASNFLCRYISILYFNNRFSVVAAFLLLPGAAKLQELALYDPFVNRTAHQFTKKNIVYQICLNKNFIGLQAVKPQTEAILTYLLPQLRQPVSCYRSCVLTRRYSHLLQPFLALLQFYGLFFCEMCFESLVSRTVVELKDKRNIISLELQKYARSYYKRVTSNSHEKLQNCYVGDT